MKFSTFFISMVFLCSGHQLCAQTLPLGLLSDLEDTYRRDQLLGLDSSGSSFMIRPLQQTTFKRLLYASSGNKLEVYALPVAVQQQMNSHHPYGRNDGSMIQAKGYQMQVSAGVYARFGPLSIQFRPEYVYARNPGFTTLQESNTAEEFKLSELIFINRIDLPERYNQDKKYNKFSLGQSSVRLTFNPVSIGFSNENLWWGPGVKNSLLMTNNASGFRHITLNTTKPVDIYIGKLEGQLIGGRLEQSGIKNVLSEKVPKDVDWRYLSGLVLTYQPKWIPNLSLSLDRAFVVYSKDQGSGFSDYFPVLTSGERPQYPDEEGYVNGQNNKKRDQYYSYSARYLLPAAQAEVYFQWGRNDRPFNDRDALVKADRTRAYIFGFRKLIPLSRQDEYIQFESEITQLAKPVSENKFNNGESWYSHAQVRDGYTHLGQVIGAGIGPGSNMQSFDVSWVKGFKKIGLGMERIDQNGDLFYQSGTTDARRHWVDLGIIGKFNWQFDRFILNSQASYIHSFNYHYGLMQPEGSGVWDFAQQDADNFQIKIGLLYNF